MKNKVSIISITVVVVVMLAGGAFALYSANQVDDESASSSSAANKSQTQDDNKYASLKGDEFDEAFIADMIAHHEGAVNMAEQAMAVTAHEEIRTLSGNIVSSQSMEMMDMREWQKDWGYEITNSGGHMSHGGGGMDMAGDMTEMMAKLQGLKGEEYDREFLKQMIVHHEQAVDMAQYADTNAKHEELKTLARDIISAQEAEIRQMKQWQQEWGY
jgi:uncharacterized protein (DUF305 family)